MALDPRLLLQAGNTTPNVMTALQQGIQAGQAIRQAPILEAMQKQRLAQAQAQEQRAADMAPLQRQLLESQISRQRGPGSANFIGTPQRVTRDGQDFLVGLTQGPGGISLSETPVSGEFVSTLGETASDIEARKAREAKERADISTTAAGEKVSTVGQAQRRQDIINTGLDSARALPTINRAIELLDTVDTGGFNAAALSAKQLFGVEGADEGELSANLGKAVLSQLRSTFGAAFTEKEGQRLERIEAGFGRNTATNRRLLGNLKQILEREIRSSRRFAEKNDDADALEELDQLQSFTLNTPQPAQATPEPVQRSGGQIMIDAQGNRAMVFPDGTFEELP